MKNALSIVFLIAGIVLIIFGVNASHSFSSGMSNFFTGLPGDKAVWFLIGGVVAATVGLAGLLRGSKA